jgi:signal recognition particle subunit SRP54
MFQNLTDRLSKTLRNLTGTGRLTENNVQETLREVRVALLEADVALPVIKQFIDDVTKEALGQDVLQSLTPGQALVKIVHNELVKLMGDACDELNLATTPPAVILMAGLQGSGKTTSVAKLARRLKEVNKKSVLVVSADIYRPAAIEQLKTLAEEVGVQFYPSTSDQQPVAIAKAAIQFAKLHFIDVVIVDTAGRLHIDQAMMSEITELHAAVQPIETLFVVDSMTGQDAVNTAAAFNTALPLTGVILTKVDGDARGGAALSIRAVTGKPLKFLGIGEKTTALEAFHPDRLASRILGMGDVLSLVEEAQRTVDHKAAEKLTKKLIKGKSFDLDDFRNQIDQMKNMGGITNLLDKLPGAHMIPSAARSQIDDKLFIQIVAIINSMTPKERRFPDLIRGSRKRRIAAGSGTEVQDVNRLLKQFAQMQKMMKRFNKGGGLLKMMSGMKGMMGGAFPQ